MAFWGIITIPIANYLLLLFNIKLKQQGVMTPFRDCRFYRLTRLRANFFC